MLLLMHNVDIEVFPIAKTSVDRDSVRRWLDYIGANNFQVPSNETITDPALLIALAAKNCYKSFEVGLNPNVTKVRTDLTEFLDNVLKSGHGSVLEHSTWTFAIEGVSRVFTGEMNRHRAGVGISENSMRYIRYSDIPWWMPLSIRDRDEDSNEIKDKKALTREIFKEAFLQMEENYNDLVKIWDLDNKDANFHYKKTLTSCFRRLIGMGVATGGIWTMNIRSVRHIISMRATEAAEEEICYVFSKIAKIMAESEPMLFADFEQTKEGFWKPKYWKV